jgi:molybdate transport system substrate-binding protein
MAIISRRSLLTGLAALSPVAPRAAAPAAPLVFGAASLKESLTEAADAYARKTGVRPVLSFASAATLARQIEQGAQADLFISADEAWMDYLAQRMLIEPMSRADFLGNRLVLIVPAVQPLKVVLKPGVPLAAMLGGGRLAMANIEAVPAGRYGKAALTRLGAWDRVAPLVVQAEDVRAAMVFVERAEARAGVVYATDARVSPKVSVAAVFPETSHPPIRYPLALVRRRGASPAAPRFRNFLLSGEGRAIFTRYGFSKP